MQEEIEHKTVNLAISTTKLSARTLLRGMQFLLRQYDKHASQGKQSMKRLVRQNRGVTNVEIQKTGIKDFDRYAKRYHIDYSIQKDLSCKPPRYLIYFKAQDTDALNAAFKEYSASVLDALCKRTKRFIQNQNKDGFQPHQTPACLLRQRGRSGDSGLSADPWHPRQYRGDVSHAGNYAPGVPAGHV